MKCEHEGCEKRADVQVTWCSSTRPWSAALCDQHVKETWEGCQRIGSVDGWSMAVLGKDVTE